MVGGHAFVLARVTWLAVNDLYGDHTVGVAHCVVGFGEFLGALEPLDCGRGLARQTAEELACLVALDHTRTEEESEARGALRLLLPHLVAEGLAAADDLFLRSVLRDLWRHGCGGGREHVKSF